MLGKPLRKVAKGAGLTPDLALLAWLDAMPRDSAGGLSWLAWMNAMPLIRRSPGRRMDRGGALVDPRKPKDLSGGAVEELEFGDN